MKPADLYDVEERVTDPNTGGQKGKKLTQIGALDPISLIIVGRVAGMGANKYAAFNFLKGFDWSMAYNAAQRHLNLFWAGEDNDPESGLPHIAHAAWMALALVAFAARGIGTDDRPPRLVEEARGIDLADVFANLDAAALADLAREGELVDTTEGGDVVAGDEGYDRVGCDPAVCQPTDDCGIHSPVMGAV